MIQGDLLISALLVSAYWTLMHPLIAWHDSVQVYTYVHGSTMVVAVRTERVPFFYEVRVTEASYHLRLAKRALSRVYNEHTKRQRRQTLVTEHFVAPCFSEPLR